MKMTVRLTMQGLIRALQGKAHDIADQMERDRRRPQSGRRAAGPRRAKGAADGLRRR